MGVLGSAPELNLSQKLLWALLQSMFWETEFSLALVLTVLRNSLIWGQAIGTFVRHIKYLHILFTDNTFNLTISVYST